MLRKNFAVQQVKRLPRLYCSESRLHSLNQFSCKKCEKFCSLLFSRGEWQFCWDELTKKCWKKGQWQRWLKINSMLDNFIVRTFYDITALRSWNKLQWKSYDGYFALQWTKYRIEWEKMSNEVKYLIKKFIQWKFINELCMSLSINKHKSILLLWL